MYKSKLWLLALLLAFSCSQDELVEMVDDMPSEEEMMMEDPTSSETISGVVSGFVTDEAGESVSFAEINTSLGRVFADELGFFEIASEQIPLSGLHLRVSHPDYMDGFRNVYPSLTSEAFTIIQLNTPSMDQFTSSEGVELSMSNGALITIPPDGIADQAGQPYDGMVLISSRFYDVTSDYFELQAPGDLRGIDSDMNVVQLLSYGMMSVILTDPAGEELNLRDGVSAQLIFPVSETVPERVPLWYYDESMGYWIEEGEAIFDGEAYVAEVNHFSFWNCDAPFQTIEIVGKVEYTDGVPAINRRVRISIVDNGVTAYGFTDAAGYFRGKVPAGQNLELGLLQSCTEQITFTLGSFSTDSDFGVFTLDVNMTANISGRLIDCMSMQGVNGYALITDNIDRFFFKTDNEGFYNGRMPLCDNTDYRLIGYDNVNNGESDVVDIILQSENEFEDILICKNSETFFNINPHPAEGPTGLNPNLLDPGQGFSYENQTLKIHVGRSDASRSESISLSIFQPKPGLNVGAASHSIYVNNSPVSYTTCFLDESCLTVNISELELEEGGHISGTYSVGAIGGNFRCKVIDVIPQEELQCVEISTSQSICSGNNPIRLMPVVSGGAEPYSYQWDDGTTDAFLLTSEERIYNLEVVDFAGNTCSMAFDHNPFPELESQTEITDATCGMSDGSVSLVISNYQGDYSITWYDGTTGNTISNKPVGTYSATIVFNDGKCESRIIARINC